MPGLGKAPVAVPKRQRGGQRAAPPPARQGHHRRAAAGLQRKGAARGRRWSDQVLERSRPGHLICLPASWQTNSLTSLRQKLQESRELRTRAANSHSSRPEPQRQPKLKHHTQDPATAHTSQRPRPAHLYRLDQVADLPHHALELGHRDHLRIVLHLERRVLAAQLLQVLQVSACGGATAAGHVWGVGAASGCVCVFVGGRGRLCVWPPVLMGSTHKHTCQLAAKAQGI